MAVSTLLTKLHLAYQSQCQQETGHLPTEYHDPEWPSPCEIGDADKEGKVQWQAYRRESMGRLESLANALECEFPDALSSLFGSFYAGSIISHFEGHQVELLQAWNEDDFERLQQNITGHVLMKRRLKQEDTVFIGLTEQEDLLLTVKLSTGEVCLEFVGKAPHHVLADNIEAFIEHMLNAY